MVITLSSMKGGCGKTTNSILITTNLAARGYKVLYFDLDPNNSGTMFFTSGIENISELIETHNIFESLSHNNVKNYVIKSNVENVDIIPSHLNIFKLRGISYNELSKTLRDNEYDFVVIDTAPTYDNIVINALTVADIILTPLQLDSFNFTTTKFLQRQIYDDCPQQAEKWYLFYSFWRKNIETFSTSSQSQFASFFENEFKNILNVHIPSATAASNYIQCRQKLGVSSSAVGKSRLAQEINNLVNMLTGKEDAPEKF